ncbi:MAG: hypothetical protein EA399_00585 [Desulfovibrionales bacterium]|nr:MAG: hypothetical protein EA399_00585 [Desulfovibrionales bacterium]
MPLISQFPLPCNGINSKMKLVQVALNFFPIRFALLRAILWVVNESYEYTSTFGEPSRIFAHHYAIKNIRFYRRIHNPTPHYSLRLRNSPHTIHEISAKSSFGQNKRLAVIRQNIVFTSN